MKYSLTIILLFFVASVFAQQDVKSNKLVQFSGIITDTDSNSVVPYVTLTNLSKKEKKYSANYSYTNHNFVIQNLTLPRKESEFLSNI